MSAAQVESGSSFAEMVISIVKLPGVVENSMLSLRLHLKIPRALRQFSGLQTDRRVGRMLIQECQVRDCRPT